MSDIILHVEASANFFILLVLLFPYIICLSVSLFICICAVCSKLFISSSVTSLFDLDDADSVSNALKEFSSK